MRVVAVDSTTLVTVGYDHAQELLQLKFCSGLAYEYFHVPAAVYRSLRDASSKGRYFNQVIRGRFPYRRIPDLIAAPRCAEKPARCDR
jgi:hypothetical protein